MYFTHTPEPVIAEGRNEIAKFVSSAVDDKPLIHLFAAAQKYHLAVNENESGFTNPSAFNVESMISIVYGLSKLGYSALRAIGSRMTTKIVGSAQYTSTFAHAFTSRVIALRYALDPRVERVTLDLGYKRLLGGGGFRWGPRPDVGVLFKNGRVKVFEVMSKTDVESKLFNRNFNFMTRNSIQGTPIVVRPLSLKMLYK
jgi:hypothetical protein